MLPNLHPRKLILACIIVLSVLLSLPYQDGRSTYAYSELIRDLAVTEQIHAGDFVLLGTPSSLGGFHFPPAYYYIIYPFAALLDFAPYSLAVASLVFSVATILLSYYVVKKWWNSEPLALTIAAVMAVSNVTFQFAKYGSNPNFIPFFALLFFYALERLLRGSRDLRFVALLAFAFAIATQLHVVPMIALPVIFIIIAARRQLKIDIRSFFLFSGIVLIMYAPYLWYEITHNFQNVLTLLRLAGTPLSFEMIALHVFQVISFWTYPWLSSNTFFDVLQLLGPKAYIGLGIALVGIIPLLRFNSRNRRFVLAQPLSTSPALKTTLQYWLIVPTAVLLLPIGGTNLYPPYYFVIMSPLVFFVTGLGFWYLLKKGLHMVAAYGAFVFIVLQIIQFVLYHQVVSGLRI